MIDRIKPDMAYVSLDIDAAEKRRLIRGDKAAWQRAEWFEEEIRTFARQVRFLYVVGGLTVDTITDYFMLTPPVGDPGPDPRGDLQAYVQRIIAHLTI
jgi:hypothetical protein